MDFAVGDVYGYVVKKMRIRYAARVVLVDQFDQVLTTGPASRPGRYIPGGGVDVGETLGDAAVREVFEETGLRITAQDLIGPFAKEHFKFGGKEPFDIQENNFFYLPCVNFEPTAENGEAYERADTRYEWVPMETLADLEGSMMLPQFTGLVKQVHGGEIPPSPFDLGFNSRV